MDKFCFQIKVNYKYNCACHALGCIEAKTVVKATTTRIKCALPRALLGLLPSLPRREFALSVQYKPIKKSPLLTGFVLPLQERPSCTLNNTSPLPFGLSPLAQTCVNSLSNYTSFARGEVGTHIERYRPLIMPLVHGRKKSTLARSLVQSVKFGAHRLAALRLVFRLRICTFR